jgi:uncharacterized membrane protein
MRSIESLKQEVEHLNGSTGITKWLSIIIVVLSVAVSIKNTSLEVFFIGLSSALLVAGIWNGYEARKKRIEEEIEERELD